MDSLLLIYVMILAMVIIAIAGFIIFQYNQDAIRKQYVNLKTNAIIGNAKNMKRCPRGCVRGRCNYKKLCRNSSGKNPDCCAFDFQCQYCKAPDGNYYLKPGQKPLIDLDYYDPNQINTKGELNELISEQNKYILSLNKEIRRKNKRINRRTR